MRTIYLFPGQGSQKKGMGEREFAAFPALVEQAEAFLGYSVRQLCRDDPDAQLQQTQFTQPVLYIVSALAYLRHRQEHEEVEPIFAAGHSVGEYAALFAAGCFDFMTGLRLVTKRGEIMSRVRDGGMLAVTGLPTLHVQAILKNFAFDAIDIANYNTATQTVLAGETSDLRESAPIFAEAGAKRALLLKVSGAFHSRYMDAAAEEFATYLDTVELRAPSLPVVANVNAQPYAKGRLKALLGQQLNHSVRWHESMQFLLRQAGEFQELGGSRILSQMIRQIQRETPTAAGDSSRGAAA